MVKAGYTEQDAIDYLNERKEQEENEQAKEGNLNNNLVNEHNLSKQDEEIIAKAVKAGFSRQRAIYYLNKEKKLKADEKDREYISDTIGIVQSLAGTTHGNVLGWLGNEEKQADIAEQTHKINLAGAEILNNKGFIAEVRTDENGQSELGFIDTEGGFNVIEPGIVRSMYNAKLEIASGIAGGVAGLSWGLRAGALAGPVGAFIGGALGAGLGAGLDYFNNKQNLSESEVDKIEKIVQTSFDTNYSLATVKMIDAGVYDGVVNALGGSAFMAASKALKSTIIGVNKVFGGLKRIKERFTVGDLEGAREYLKEAYDITDRQIDQIVGVYEKELGRKLTKREVLPAVLRQQPKGQEIYGAIDHTEKIRVNINRISKEVLGINRKIVDGETAGNALYNYLDAYKTEVDKFFRESKQIASELIDKTDYKSNLNKLTVEHMQRELKKTSVDGEELDLVVDRIEKSLKGFISKDFNDVLEFRQKLNSIKNDTKNPPMQDILKSTIANIDKEISSTLKKYLPKQQAERLNNNLKESRKLFREIQMTKNNAVYKVIIDPNTKTKDLANVIEKLAITTDKNNRDYVDFMKILPDKLKPKVEGILVDRLTERNVVNFDDDFQAINYHELLKSLKRYDLETKTSKDFIKMVEEFSKVYGNDYRIINSLHMIRNNTAPTYLTDNIYTRAKFALASKLFNYVKIIPPTKQAKILTLIRATQKFVDEPLKLNNAKELLKNLPPEQKVEVEDLMKQVRIGKAKEVAETGVKGQDLLNPEQKLTVYKYVGKDNKKISKSSGKLGSGYYLTSYNKKPATIPDKSLVKIELDTRKLADMEQVSKVMGKEITSKDVRTMQGLQEKLKEYGFEGIISEDRVMLFNEPKTK